MKKVVLVFFFLFTGGLAIAQSDKYVQAMETLVARFDSTRSFEGLIDLGNSFQRIAEAETNQWLPYYYAALANITLANLQFSAGQRENIDALTDKAEPLLSKAEELQKDNCEVFCLKKMFNTAKMMVDPMNRYMTYGNAAAAALATAKKLDPENPRVYLLEAQDKFFTPEQFGGSKKEAKTLFEESVKKFETFKPESNIHPHWGLAQAKYFLSQLQ